MMKTLLLLLPLVSLSLYAAPKASETGQAQGLMLGVKCDKGDTECKQALKAQKKASKEEWKNEKQQTKEAMKKKEKNRGKTQPSPTDTTEENAEASMDNEGADNE